MRPPTLPTLLALLALAAPLAAAQTPPSGVRFAHLGPGTRTIDVRSDARALVTGLAAGSVSRYLFLAPGEHALELLARAALAPADAPVEAEPTDEPAATEEPAPAELPAATEDPGTVRDVVVYEGPLEVPEAAYGTVLLVRAAPPEEGAPPALETVWIDDPLTELPPPGAVLVRVVHGAAEAGPLRVGLAPVDGTSEALALELEPLAAGGYDALPAGTYRLRVATAEDEAAVDLDRFRFESGLLYTLYVARSAAGGLALVPAVDGGVARQAP